MYLLLCLLIGSIAIIGAVAFVVERMTPNRRATVRRLVAIGTFAVVVLELAVVLLLAGTGDRFDPQCMQSQSVCPSTQQDDGPGTAPKVGAASDADMARPVTGPSR